MGVPYYDRPLESFSDETITSARLCEHGLWYAVLDWGGYGYPGDLDFSAGGKTREEAVARCASAIREKIAGCLHSYDLNYRLKRRWAEKEESNRKDGS